MAMTRLPAFPLIANDPYFSIWMPSDNMATADTIHWSGPQKPVRVLINVDGGAANMFLGKKCIADLTICGVIDHFTIDGETREYH